MLSNAIDYLILLFSLLYVCFLPLQDDCQGTHLAPCATVMAAAYHDAEFLSQQGREHTTEPNTGSNSAYCHREVNNRC